MRNPQLQLSQDTDLASNSIKQEGSRVKKQIRQPKTIKTEGDTWVKCLKNEGYSH